MIITEVDTYQKKFILSGILIVFCILLQAQETIVGLNYYDHSPVTVEISDGIIRKITRLDKLPDGVPHVYIAPGLIDNQVNGFAGVTFALGSGELTPDGVRKATKELWKYGVTTYFPTLTTNSRELFFKNLSILREVKNDKSLYGSIAGIHLEGPYINPEDGYRGAHPKEYVRLPDWDEFMEFREASGNNILQITVAPEMEGALDFIEKCSRDGIVVGLGHHNAPAEKITAAIARGAKISTHLGNGAAGIVNRHYNPFWSQLADDRLNISIICDGFHLPGEVISVFYKTKGAKRVILTSDVTSYGSLPQGDYTTDEGHSIQITKEGKLWNNDQNGLYGSASAITKSVGHIMKVTGCSLAESIQMSSTNPARLYGLYDRGTLEPRKRADLIVFTLENFNLKVRQTWVEGNLVYEKK
uniref:N-acetylglucosamine-6-phosphate deacetylase n=1 Tax=uncultured Draconibacterium sp. TaxID=1573823 RepID=UPI0032179455